MANATMNDYYQTMGIATPNPCHCTCKTCRAGRTTERPTVVHVSLHEDLKAMRFILSQWWTKNTAGINARGESVNPRSRYASAWCIVGAMDLVVGDDRERSNRLREIIAHAIGTTLNDWDFSAGDSITSWNDNTNRTQAQVVALMDQCINETRPKREVIKSCLAMFM